MKIKLTAPQLIMCVLACASLSFVILSILWYIPFPFDRIENDTLNFGALHTIINIIWIIATIGFVIYGACLVDSDDRSSPYHKEDVVEFEIMKNKKIIAWIVVVFILIGLYSISRPAITGSITIYNQSVSYQNAYKQKTDEKMGFYDKLWKVYLQKNQIAELNKDVFLEVTQLIMEGRADGDKVAWKWVKENQQIPYSEFTKFYSDLSDFVFSQREAYFKIEQECMTIVNKNNTMLDTFPNNIYNKILKCPKIEFEYSFTSKQTKEVFKTGEENIK